MSLPAVKMEAMDNSVQESPQRYPARIRVGPFSATDRVEAVRIFIDAFTAPPWDEPWTEFEAYQRIEAVRTAPGAAGWVARDQAGVLTGFALGSEVIAADASERVFLLQEMAVDEQVRCRGIGSALLRAVEQHARDRGLAAVEIVTVAGKYPCYFYETNGYTQVATEGPHAFLGKRL